MTAGGGGLLVGGNRKRPTEEMAMTTRLIVVLVMAMVVTRSAKAQTSCTMVNKIQSNCVAPSGEMSITVTCPQYFALRITSVSWYRTATPTAGCSAAAPPTDPTATGACLQQNLTTTVTGAGSQCAFSSSMYVCTYMITAPPAQPVAPCTGSDYFALTAYRCEAVFLTPPVGSPPNTPIPATSTGVSISLSSDAIVSNAGVAFSGGLSYVYTTTSYCSVYVPAGVELFVAVSFFIKSNSACTAGRLVVDNVDGNVVSPFCAGGQSMSLGCGNGADRYLRIRFLNDMPAVGSIFQIQFTVPPGSKIIAQCGTPPFPLNVTIPTTSNPTTAIPSTTTASRTTAAAAAQTTNGPASVPAAAQQTTGVIPPVALVDQTNATMAVTSGSPSTTTTTVMSSTTTTILSSVLSSFGPSFGVAMTTTATAGQSSPKQQQSVNGWSSSATIGVVVGCVIAAAIVLLAITIAICYRWRQAKLMSSSTTSSGSNASTTKTLPLHPEQDPTPPQTYNYQLEPPPSDAGKPYRNITEFYVDGNSASKLVLNRQQEPKIFKTILRL